jgi:hypothetical protein
MPAKSITPVLIGTINGKSMTAIATEKISPDELKEYNIVINKMISQIKKYDPKFFDDFEKHTGKKIDFDDRPKF